MITPSSQSVCHHDVGSFLILCCGFLSTAIMLRMDGFQGTSCVYAIGISRQIRLKHHAPSSKLIPLSWTGPFPVQNVSQAVALHTDHCQKAVQGKICLCLPPPFHHSCSLSVPTSVSAGINVIFFARLFGSFFLSFYSLFFYSFFLAFSVWLWSSQVILFICSFEMDAATHATTVGSHKMLFLSLLFCMDGFWWLFFVFWFSVFWFWSCVSMYRLLADISNLIYIVLPFPWRFSLARFIRFIHLFPSLFIAFMAMWMDQQLTRSSPVVWHLLTFEAKRTARIACGDDAYVFALWSMKIQKYLSFLQRRQRTCLGGATFHFGPPANPNPTSRQCLFLFLCRKLQQLWSWSE